MKQARFKLVAHLYEGCEDVVHIENVSYALACSLQKLMVMAGYEDAEFIQIEEMEE